ncbi:MAG: alpha/beta fold hydrolase [Alcanivoracaceae bacterium]|nr:alpha/beta fold hydrolase [Alcanivoracaceae bacterium]
MLYLLKLLLGTILAITAVQTLLMYTAWYYDRRNFADTLMPEEAREVLLFPGLWGMFWEWMAISLLVVSYPLRLVHDASPVRARVQGETPIILVHGYGGNAANFLTLQWRLKARGWANVYAVSYTPPTIDARKLSQQVADHVNRILAATGAEKAHLVCHSMGGPLTRYALHHLDLAGKLDRVITLGSPHVGTRIASLFPPMGAAFQMRHHSDFLNQLNALEATPGGAQFYSIYSNFDNFIVPSSSAMLGGNAKNIHVPYLGHCSLLYSPAVLAHIERCLAEPKSRLTAQG